MKLNKSLIAAAVAAAVLAPTATLADVTVYGSVRLGIEGTDDGDDLTWDVRNESSRLGFKANEELSNGLKAVAHYEMGVDAGTGTFGGDTANRLSYVGMEGGFGGVYLGSQWSPMYLLVGAVTDQFNGFTSRQSITNGTFRLPNVAAYAGTFGPVKVMAAAVIQGTDDDVIDHLQVGAKFNAGPATVGVVIHQAAESVTGDDSAMRIAGAATFKAGEAKFGLNVISTEKGFSEDNTDDWMGIEGYGAMGFGGGNKVHLSYGQTDTGDNTPTFLTLGYQKNFSKATRAWIEARRDDPDTDADEVTGFNIGMRHDF